MSEIIQQIIGLSTFFAFPALQYVLLKRYVRKQGQPELWYLPKYGFRLVARNIGGKRVLSEIKYRALYREVLRSGPGTSVGTWKDHGLLQRDDFFLFPGSDQILLAFRLEQHANSLELVVLRQLTEEGLRLPLSEGSTVIADYTATVENWLNFDVKLSKRIELSAADLHHAYLTVQHNDVERRFPVTRVREVG